MSDLNPIRFGQFDPTRESRVGILPTRGEKRIVPVGLETKTVTNEKGDPSKLTYESVSNAKATFSDYMTIRIPRKSGWFTYRFLINPKSVQVSRQAMDSQAMTRAGWQIGIWGEDMLEISLSGSTAAQFSDYGLTDSLEAYTLSYRNLMELVNLFENNGYIFEGEEMMDGVEAPTYTRKRIKSHSDVILSVGNFEWRGMFNSMTCQFNAEQSFNASFNISFIAWKERFKESSPWRNGIKNEVIRGHDSGLILKLLQEKEKTEQPPNLPPLPGLGLSPYIPDSIPTLPTQWASKLGGR